MSTYCIIGANRLQSNTGWCIIKSINTHISGAFIDQGKQNIYDSQMALSKPALTQPHTGTSLNDMRDCPRKHSHCWCFSVLWQGARHFWSTDLDLNEMKVADLQWERTGGDVESRLLLVRLLCLLAVGPHCWHISSVSDSTKLKMLGLSTDPISLWQGLRGFQRFRWRALSFSAQSHYGWVLLLYNTVCSNREPTAANRIKDH